MRVCAAARPSPSVLPVTNTRATNFPFWLSRSSAGHPTHGPPLAAICHHVRCLCRVRGLLGCGNILGSVFLTLLLGAVAGMLNAALPRHPLCDKHGQAGAWRAADRGGGGRRLAVRGLGVKGLSEPRCA